MTSTITETVNKLTLNATDDYSNTLKAPLKRQGVVEKHFKVDDLTPSIGTLLTEGPQLNQILNNDELLRDLAILVAERGVVFFRNQEIDTKDQEKLGDVLGKLTGKPKSSELHIHPLTREFGELGDKISIISSESNKAYYNGQNRSKLASGGWHSDITFEPIPSDYAILKIVVKPETGGDTLWASGYELYDRLTAPFQKFLEGLTAVHEAPRFREISQAHNFKLRDNRGSPLNTGDSLTTTHPVIRTNPVTGLKSVFVNKGFTTRINELNKDESDAVLEYLFTLTKDNHDLQVRFKWQLNDVAIWDNRSNYHTATNDYNGTRLGNRVVSLGEKPYFDAKSQSRYQATGVSYNGF